MKKPECVKRHRVLIAWIMKKPEWVKNHRVLTALIGLVMIAFGTLAVAKPDTTGIFADSTTNIEKDDKGNIIKTVEVQQSGKTLWDLLQLFGTLALPVLLLFLANRFQEQEKEAQETKRQLEEANAKKNQQAEKDIADKNQQIEKDIAEDNQRGQALETYLDRIADILLDQQLFSLDRSNPTEKLRDDTALDIIRARTLEIIRRFGRDENKIDRERKGRILLFLYDVELIRKNNKTLKTDKAPTNLSQTDKPLLNLKQADFSGADLPYADIKGVNLKGANLKGANLSLANLRDANLRDANLRDANLRGADLRGANLKGAICSGTICSGADYDDKTTLPTDFDPQKHGMVKDILELEIRKSTEW